MIQSKTMALGKHLSNHSFHGNIVTIISRQSWRWYRLALAVKGRSSDQYYYISEARGSILRSRSRQWHKTTQFPGQYDHPQKLAFFNDRDQSVCSWRCTGLPSGHANNNIRAETHCRSHTKWPRRFPSHNPFALQSRPRKPQSSGLPPSLPPSPTGHWSLTMMCAKIWILPLYQIP